MHQQLTRAQCNKTFYRRNLLIFLLSHSVCYDRLEKIASEKKL